MFASNIIDAFMKRDILKIDEELCNGCGQCVPNCHEGALQVIDGKVRLVSELMCDGLGACIGHCPEGAITIEKSEAEPYNETSVMEQMKNKGRNTIIAHLKHLKDHGETVFLQDGVGYLKNNRSELNFNLDELISEVHNHGRLVAQAPQQLHVHEHGHAEGGCPGSRERVIVRNEQYLNNQAVPQISLQSSGNGLFRCISLIRMHHISKDLIFSCAADCVAFSMGGFHNKYLKGKSLAIACPKLDHGTEIYIDKLTALIEDARINTITVMMMEVPCCGGLLQMVKAALSKSSRKIPVKKIIVGINGEVLQEEWV